MASAAPRGVDPSSLALHSASADEHLSSSLSGAETDDEQEDETYVIDKLLDYRLQDNTEYCLEQDEWPNPKRRFEVRYLVSWVGYPAEDNSWEPRESFTYWLDIYDKELAAIEAAHPKRPTVAQLKAEAKRCNTLWQKEQKQRIKEEKLKGSAKGRKGRGKGKSKVEPVKEVKAEQPVETKPKRKRSMDSRASSVASASTAKPGVDGRTLPKKRSTRTSTAYGDIDPKALQEYLETNAPPALRQLRVTPPPERGESGQLIRSPSEDGSRGGSAERPIPPHEGHPLSAVRGKDVTIEEQQLAADSGATPFLREPLGGTAPAGPPSVTPSALGFADSDSDDDFDGTSSRHPEHAHSELRGFADDDDTMSDNEPYFPSLVAEQPLHTQVRQSASAQPAVGFAGSSDDDDHEVHRRDAHAADANTDAVSSRAGTSEGASRRDEHPPEHAEKGFADSESDGDEEGSTAPAAENQPTGFADSSDEEKVLASASTATSRNAGFADDDDGEGAEAHGVASSAVDDSAAQSGQATASRGEHDAEAHHDDGEGGSHDQSVKVRSSVPHEQQIDEGDVNTFVEKPSAAVVQARADASPAAVVTAAQTEHAHASSEEDVPLAELVGRQLGGRRRKSSLRSSAASNDMDDEPTESRKRLRRHGASRKTESDHLGRRASVRMVIKPSSPDEAGPSISRKRLSAGTRPSEQRRNLIILEDSEEEQSDISSPVVTQEPRGISSPVVTQEPRGISSPVVAQEQSGISSPVVTQAQRLKSLKIPKLGQNRPSLPPVPSPVIITHAHAVSDNSSRILSATPGLDRSQQSPGVSNETSSHDSGAHARKAHDPFNQGIARPTSLKGYVRLNGDLLRQKKLSAALTRGETVRYPPGVESEVDKIRHLWSIGTEGHPIRGVPDFDELMHLEGRPREAYITDAPDEGLVGRDKRARNHFNDYQALQLVLSSIDGVRQADSPRESVSAIFVHASEIGKVGRFAGPFHQLERFRMNEHAVFFVYGEGDKRKRAMQPFWRPVTSFTFTPAAFARNPARITELIRKAPEMFNVNGLRSQFPWMPLQYLLPGGAFGRADAVAGPKLPLSEAEMVTLKVQLHSLALQNQLPLATVSACSPASHKSLVFPDHYDRSEYQSAAWSTIAEVYPPELCALDLAGLQKVVCTWRSEYPQIRRWLVIGTPEEFETCAALAGIHLYPLEQAERALA